MALRGQRPTHRVLVCHSLRARTKCPGLLATSVYRTMTPREGRKAMSITRCRWDLPLLYALLTIVLTGACAHPREHGSASATTTPTGHLGFVSSAPTGDALYVALGNANRIETVRYVGIRTPEI